MAHFTTVNAPITVETMPLHDWTQVSAGTFHDFHNAWITHLKEALNAGLLPPPYYALGEQRAGDVGPDVLTLRESANEPAADGGGMVALAAAPPKVELAQEATGDLAFYLARQRSVVIRHASGDSVVAIIEVVSPANKHSQETLDRFADKVIAALHDGIHVLVVDLSPPTDRDQDGIHDYIWHGLLAGTYDARADRSRTLASYYASPPLRAYVQTLA